MEVQNKTLSLKKGNIELSLINTSFDTAARFALISPCSGISSGLDQKRFVIQESFSGIFGRDEFRKWKDFAGAGILVKSPDGVTRNGVAELVSASSNTIVLKTNLGFVPVAGDIMEFADFDQTSDTVRLLYASMNDTVFGDGSIQYQMI